MKESILITLLQYNLVTATYHIYHQNEIFSDLSLKQNKLKSGPIDFEPYQAPILTGTTEVKE